MAQASGSAYAAALASHALYEILLEQPLLFFKERRLAFRNSVAGNGGQPELLLRDSLLLERLL